MSNVYSTINSPSTPTHACTGWSHLVCLYAHGENFEYKNKSLTNNFASIFNQYTQGWSTLVIFSKFSPSTAGSHFQRTYGEKLKRLRISKNWTLSVRCSLTIRARTSGRNFAKFDQREDLGTSWRRNVVTQIGVKTALCIFRELVAKFLGKYFEGSQWKTLFLETPGCFEGLQRKSLLKYWTLKNIWVFIEFANHHLLLDHLLPSLQMGKIVVKNVVSWAGISYYLISLLQSHG
jgi:hypothetical protein